MEENLLRLETAWSPSVHCHKRDYANMFTLEAQNSKQMNRLIITVIRLEVSAESGIDAEDVWAPKGSIDPVSSDDFSVTRDLSLKVLWRGLGLGGSLYLILSE